MVAKDAEGNSTPVPGLLLKDEASVYADLAEHSTKKNQAMSRSSLFEIVPI